MPITPEELAESIKRLRERRLAIPALRDYRPQSRTKAKATSKPDVPIEETFGDLFSRANANLEGGD